MDLELLLFSEREKVIKSGHQLMRQQSTSRFSKVPAAYGELYTALNANQNTRPLFGFYQDM